MKSVVFTVATKGLTDCSNHIEGHGINTMGIVSILKELLLEFRSPHRRIIVYKCRKVLLQVMCIGRITYLCHLIVVARQVVNN